MKNLILCLLQVFSVSAFAVGTEVGNGGIGIMVDGKVCVFDLFESGLQIQEKFQFDETQVQKYQKWLETSLDSPEFPLNLVAQKLANLGAQFPLPAHILASAIKLYHWQLVSSELKQLTHDFLSPIDTQNLQLVQVATRIGNTIYINRTAWSKMSEPDRAALIMHEAFYSLLLGHSLDGSDVAAAQMNLRARQLNAFYWAHDLTYNLQVTTHYFQLDLEGFVQDEGRHQQLVRFALPSLTASYEVDYNPSLFIHSASAGTLKLLGSHAVPSQKLKELCFGAQDHSVVIHYQADTVQLSTQSDLKQSQIVSGHYVSTYAVETVNFHNTAECEASLLKSLESWVSDFK